MSVQDFWSCTPHETRLVCEAAGARELALYRRGLWIAWHTAALTRVKRMPNLGGMLKRLGPGGEKAQTASEILQTAGWITAAYQPAGKGNNEER